MPPLRALYLDELTRFQDRINSLFERALVSAELEEREAAAGFWRPAIDLMETGDAYLLHAELAGVPRDEVQLHVEERRLEVSGRRQPSPGHRHFLRMERSYGPFRRTFELAAPVDPEAVSAAMTQGVLRVHLPKRRTTVVVAAEEPA